MLQQFINISTHTDFRCFAFVQSCSIYANCNTDQADSQPSSNFSNSERCLDSKISRSFTTGQPITQLSIESSRSSWRLGEKNAGWNDKNSWKPKNLEIIENLIYIYVYIYYIYIQKKVRAFRMTDWYWCRQVEGVPELAVCVSTNTWINQCSSMFMKNSTWSIYIMSHEHKVKTRHCRLQWFLCFKGLASSENQPPSDRSPGNAAATAPMTKCRKWKLIGYPYMKHYETIHESHETET